MRFFLCLILLTTAACGSPSKNAVLPSTTVSPPAEVEAVFAYAPRRAKDLELAILGDPKIQNCLKAAPETLEDKFSAGIEGYLDYKGVMEGVAVSAPGPLKACLTKEFASLVLGRGRAGPFKMQVTRKTALLP